MEQQSQPILAQFRPLYEKYVEKIFRFIFRRVGDESIAHDITSQTFLKAMTHLPKYELRQAPFSAWLYKIAFNEINQFYRKNKAVPLFSLDQDLIENWIEEAAYYVKEDTFTELIDFLEQLPTEQVTILHLRFFEGKTFKEIAYILDLTQSKAKMSTYRSLQKLKQYFAQHSDF